MVRVHYIFKIKGDDLTWEIRKLDVHIDPSLIYRLRHFLSCNKFVKIDLCCVLGIDITIELLIYEIPDQHESQYRYYASYISRL